MWRRFTIALSFLTIFGLAVSGEMSSGDFGDVMHVFLLWVCWSAGSPGNGPAAPSRYAPASPCRRACAFMTLVTRGFHLDGLADLADGIGGGYTPQRRLEIMKDSATGAFGALALVLAILLKTSAIYSLIMAKSWIALAIVPAMSRFAIVVCAYKSPCARTEGLAKSSIEFVTRGTLPPLPHLPSFSPCSLFQSSLWSS